MIGVEYINSFHGTPEEKEGSLRLPRLLSFFFVLGLAVMFIYFVGVYSFLHLYIFGGLLLCIIGVFLVSLFVY